MAPANNTSPAGAGVGKPAASKRATASSQRNGASAARPKPAARAKTTGAKTTSARATRTRAPRGARAAAARSSSATTGAAGTRTRTDVVGSYAERAVLIPVGAALIARERVLSGVNDAIATYATPSRAQTQLRRFEHRGSTARNRLEREVRKTRTRVERELRQRRRDLERRVTGLEERRDSVAKSFSAQVEQTSTQIENSVQARIKAGGELASKVQERILSLV
jgi:hypothetical protein